MAKVRVAVVMGGRSSEHDVSLDSARSVLDALDPARFETVTVEIGRDGRWELGSGSRGELERDGRSAVETLPVPTSRVPESLAGVDVVFPVLHGPFGEDGTVQGLLELANVPYVGAGVTASALCMDKDLFKAVLRDKGIPVTKSVTLLRRRIADARAKPAHPESGAASGALDGFENPFGFPVFVKPARLGSSVGITKARSEDELRAGIELAFQHDEKVLVEEFVRGVEVECSVLGNDEPIASIPGEIVANADWYDYSSKYDEGGMDLVIPPRVSEEAIERVQELSVAAFRVTDCEGMARADCFVREDGEVLVNELNTIPGFTATSVYAKLFEASGIPYEELLERLVQLALERHERRSKLKF
jgi:D-alanine-D-alanine ligase